MSGKSAIGLNFFSLKIELRLAFKNAQFISLYLGFLGRALFTELLLYD